MIVAAVLLLASGLGAQTVPTNTYGPLYTPEIHLGSANEPSTITAPPVVVEVPGQTVEPEVSNAPPASTELLSSRHFDFIVSPVSESVSTHGNIADTTISLGEYARQLRAQKNAASSGSTTR
jgi:hypothetical protein